MTGFRTSPEYSILQAGSINVSKGTTGTGNNNFSITWDKTAVGGYNDNWLLIVQLMLPSGEVVYETAGKMHIDIGGSSSYGTLWAAAVTSACSSATFADVSGTTRIRDKVSIAQESYVLDEILSSGACDASSIEYSLFMI